MKILPIVRDIKSDVNNTGTRIKKAADDGYSIALRTARIYKQNNLRKYIGVTRSVGNKILSGTTVNELPYVAGALGLLVPFPFASPVMMGFGFLAKQASNGAAWLYNRQCDAHIGLGCSDDYIM